jgi:GTP-binding protein
VHLIDGFSRDPESDFEVINEELRLFNPTLASRPQVVALNKIDVTEVRDGSQRVLAKLRARGAEDPLAISAATGEGVIVLLRRVAALLRELPPPEPQQAVVAPATLLPESDMAFTIDREPSGEWRVRGKRIERIVVMTKWEYYDAVMRFQRILEALGITAALRERGVQEGDIVLIGDRQLEWSEDNAF